MTTELTPRDRVAEIDQPITLKVVEPPVDRLRRLALVPETPREDLWEAIAEAVINVNERMAELEADAVARRRVIAAIQKRASAPLGQTTDLEPKPWNP